MKILIYYEIEKPQKEGLKLRVKTSKVSVHRNRLEALHFAYESYGLHRMTKDEKNIIFTESGHWNRWKYHFAIVAPLQKNAAYPFDTDSVNVKNKIYKLFKKMTFESSFDVSIYLAGKTPLFKMQKGFEIAQDGIVENNWQVYDSTYYRYWSDVRLSLYIGKNASEMIEKRSTGISGIHDIDGKVISVNSPNLFFAKPIKK